ncbi:MAG: phenylacetate--CoA ligase [Peptococcaceae bacterium]|nr:phenylacetate--CoA ligase [Peptococcaceae bacterium]
MIWNQSVECMDREDMEALQLGRLQDMVDRIYYNVPFYRSKLQEVGFMPGDVKHLSDLSKLPFTTKKDLRDNYPFGLFAVPMSEVVRVHASSGTTGKPTVVGYSRRDLDTWAETAARCLSMANTNRQGIVQISYGYGLFTGGLGLHGGAERIGASVIPTSSGNTEKQLMLMEDFGTTLLACTPSYAMHLAESREKAGMDRSNFKLRYGVFGAEPWSERMRAQIEEQWQIKAYDIYGLSEVMGPGVANDCDERCGLHVHEDHFYPEIIDPLTEKVLPEGEKGELVFTTLTKEAFPLLRYRTRDISELHKEPCACGRTLARIARLTGRTDDMLIIRGVNVFPTQVESVLLEFGETAPHYQLIVEREGTLDRLTIEVELSPALFSDTITGLAHTGRRRRDRLDSVLGISAVIKLVEPGSIPRFEGKSQRVIDKREY